MTIPLTIEPTTNAGPRGTKAGPQVLAEVSKPAPMRSGHTIVALHGDLDIATSAALRERLLGALRPGAGLLIIDMGGVAFCDAAGLAVLIGTQRRAAGLDMTLRLAAPNPGIAKLLGVTGLDRCLTVHPTVRDALALSLPRSTSRVPEAMSATSVRTASAASSDTSTRCRTNRPQESNP